MHNCCVMLRMRQIEHVVHIPENGWATTVAARHDWTKCAQIFALRVASRATFLAMLALSE